MNTIENVIGSFDVETRKGFDFSDIARALAELDNTEKTKLEFTYEYVAMQLMPSPDKEPWGYYFDPWLTLADKKGTPKYLPA